MDRHKDKDSIILARDVVAEMKMALVHFELLNEMIAYYIQGAKIIPVIIKRTKILDGKIAFNLNYANNKHFCNSAALEHLTFCPRRAIERVMAKTQELQAIAIETVLKSRMDNNE